MPKNFPTLEVVVLKGSVDFFFPALLDSLIDLQAYFNLN